MVRDAAGSDCTLLVMGLRNRLARKKMIAVQILRSDFASGTRPLAEWAWDVQATCAQHVCICIYIYICPHDTRTRQQW